MEHMTGIELRCTKDQKDLIIDLLAEGLTSGISKKEDIKKLLEKRIMWDIIELVCIENNSEQDFTKYLNKMKKYSEKISNGEVSAEDSLKSLIKAGICDKEKNINEKYKIEERINFLYNGK